MRTQDLKPGTAYLYRENGRGPGVMVYAIDNRPWRQRQRGYSGENPTLRTLSLTDDDSGQQFRGAPVLMIDKFEPEFELPEQLLAQRADIIAGAVRVKGVYRIQLREVPNPNPGVRTRIEVPEAIWERAGLGDGPVRHRVTVHVVNPRWIVGPWSEHVESHRRNAERTERHLAEERERARAQHDRMGQIAALGRFVNVDLTLRSLSTFDDTVIVSSADLLTVLQRLHAARSTLTHPGDAL
jgi:hypothetical protein